MRKCNRCDETSVGMHARGNKEICDECAHEIGCDCCPSINAFVREQAIRDRLNMSIDEIADDEDDE